MSAYLCFRHLIYVFCGSKIYFPSNIICLFSLAALACKGKLKNPLHPCETINFDLDE